MKHLQQFAMYNFITTKLQGHKEIELFKVKMRYGIKKLMAFVLEISV